MTTLLGHNEGEDRMKRETMEPRTHVAIDHNYYSEDPESHCAYKKNHGKHHEGREHHADGDSVGDDERQHYALGMAAKVRKHYPMT